jgi:hypothetical protein
MQAFTALATRPHGHHPHLPWLTKGAKNRPLLQWHIYCAKPCCHLPVSHSLRNHWEMRFHAGLQTICHLKRCRLSDLSAQKLQIHFPLRQMIVTSATMTGPGGVAVTLRAPSNSLTDPNQGYLRVNEAYVLADAPLSPNTTYQVFLTGTNGTTPFSRSFSFTTTIFTGP